MLSATLRLATFESCDPALYRRDFERDFKKVEQLVRAVESVGNGTDHPFDARTLARPRGACHLHPFPLFGPMWNPFGSAFGQPTFGHRATVMPLQLVADEDLEMLEAFQAIGAMSIVDALTRRVANPAWVESRMTQVILRAWRLRTDNLALLALYRTAAALRCCEPT